MHLEIGEAEKPPALDKLSVAIGQTMYTRTWEGMRVEHPGKEPFTIDTYHDMALLADGRVIIKTRGREVYVEFYDVNQGLGPIYLLANCYPVTDSGELLVNKSNELFRPHYRKRTIRQGTPLVRNKVMVRTSEGVIEGNRPFMGQTYYHNYGASHHIDGIDVHTKKPARRILGHGWTSDLEGENFYWHGHLMSVPGLENIVPLHMYQGFAIVDGKVKTFDLRASPEERDAIQRTLARVRDRDAMGVVGAYL